MKKIAIIDYGVGNLYSLHKALKKYSDAFLTEEAGHLKTADAIVLPGDGAFHAGMEGLKRRELLSPLLAHIRDGIPVLGICLGAQILLAHGHEFGSWEGLGIIPGSVVRFPASTSAKIPHINWSPIVKPHAQVQERIDSGQAGLNPRTEVNDPHASPHLPSRTGVAPTGISWENTILEGVPSGAQVYFVHSFILQPENPAHVLAETTYGGTTYSSAVRAGRVYGCQFHPEKSGEVGLKIIENFVNLL